MARVILVTGANRGIGLAIVQTLATRHPADTILLAARDPTTIAPALATLPASVPTANIHPLALDVTSDASIAAALATVTSAHAGRLDILVNNAGVAPLPAPDDSPAAARDKWARTLDTNVSSLAALSVACAPLLARSQLAPRIVNVSSGRASMARSAGGDLPPTRAVAYSVSKAAVNMLTVELAKSYREMGVGVLCVNPGHCKTAFNNYRGTRDVLDGGKCVVDVIDGGMTEGFWEALVDGGEVSRAPW